MADTLLVTTISSPIAGIQTLGFLRHFHGLPRYLHWETFILCISGAADSLFAWPPGSPPQLQQPLPAMYPMQPPPFPQAALTLGYRKMLVPGYLPQAGPLSPTLGFHLAGSRHWSLCILQTPGETYPVLLRTLFHVLP